MSTIQEAAKELACATAELRNLIVRASLCWWLGCKPALDHERHPCDESPEPCARCHAPEVSYGDLVGDTRHNALMWELRYWLFRKWFPSKCWDCGKRWGRHDDCSPF